jgi:hypothetical protein
MNLSSSTIYIILGVCVFATAAQAIWVFRKHDTYRLRRILGLWVPGESGPRHKFGRFYWKEGVFAGEITQVMSAEYAEKHRWLLSHKNQRRFVVFAAATWLLNLFGAFDLSWNLGFSETLFSWWSILMVASYLLLRQSVRALADAPTELIDERLRAVRDSAYRSAYRLMGWIFPITGGLVIGVAQSADESLTVDHFVFGLFCFGFVFEGLPNMFIAWRGKAKELH